MRAKRRAVTWLLAAVALVLLAGVIALRPTSDGTGIEREHGRVMRVRSVACPDTAPAAGIRCRQAVVRVGGSRVAVAAGRYDRGDRVTLAPTADGYRIVEPDRRRPLLIIAAAAVALAIVVVRRRAARLVGGIGAITFISWGWAVPAIGDGRNLLLVDLVSGVVVVLVVTLVLHDEPDGAVAALAAAGVTAGAAVLVHLAAEAATFSDLTETGATLAVALGAGALAARSLRSDDRGRDVVAVTGVLVTAIVAAGASRVGLLNGGPPLADAMTGDTSGPFLLAALSVLALVPLSSPLTAAAIGWLRRAPTAAPDDPRRFRGRREREVWSD